jgi:MinD-like ATPase involved in chromosome partitioning or flagellar assembly
MAAQGRSVLAVEFRPHVGSFPTLLGLTAPKGLGELLAMEARAISQHEISTRLYSHSSGLKLLCAPHELLPDVRIEAAQADAVLQVVSGMADVILIDLAPYPLVTIQSALQHSATAVLVVEPVKDCVLVATAMAGFMRSHGGASTEHHLLLVTRAPMAVPLAVREIEAKLGFEEARAIPPAVDEHARAQHLNRPVVDSQPESFAAQAYKELAAQLI